MELPTAQTRCDVIIKRILLVSPRGDVTPCPFVRYVIGSVRDLPLEEIWRRHVSALRLDFRDDCLMNDVRQRELMERHAASVAGGLG